MTPRKILYGICGIGRGHASRQLPIVEHFARSSRIVLFAYGESERIYRERFRDVPSVQIVPVVVPFYVGTPDGLDFLATARQPLAPDFFRVNAEALATAQRLLGVPDLVISDYEPVSASYAYATGAPLVTIDQQSKYLCGDFPERLLGQGFRDEVARLRLFFPRAEARIACSFFRVAERAEAREDVLLCPPIIKSSILQMVRNPSMHPSLLFYLSAQQDFSQDPATLTRILALFPETDFHLFSPDGLAPFALPAHVHVYAHGDARFAKVLASCHGLISTAGHTLLSEAMYLGIPVYALPLPLYEQAMNAHVIAEYGFGIAHPTLEPELLGQFLRGLPQFAAAIMRNEEGVLLRDPGQEQVIAFLEKRFFPV